MGNKDNNKNENQEGNNKDNNKNDKDNQNGKDDNQKDNNKNENNNGNDNNQKVNDNYEYYYEYYNPNHDNGKHMGYYKEVNGYTVENFDGYEITTVNPGLSLLLYTTLICLLAYIIFGIMYAKNKFSISGSLQNHMSHLGKTIYSGKKIDKQNEQLPSEKEGDIELSTTKEQTYKPPRSSTGSKGPTPQDINQYHERRVKVVSRIGRSGKKVYTLVPTTVETNNSSTVVGTRTTKYKRYVGLKEQRESNRPQSSPVGNRAGTHEVSDHDNTSLGVSYSLISDERSDSSIVSEPAKMLLHQAVVKPSSASHSVASTHSRANISYSSNDAICKTPENSKLLKAKTEEDMLTFSEFNPLTLLHAFIKMANNDNADSSSVISSTSNIKESRKKDLSEGLMKNMDSANDVKSTDGDRSGGSTNGEFNIISEYKKIFNLAGPWTVTSIVSYGSSLLVVVFISRFLGIDEMITYTYVWYIISILHFPSRALFSSIYHHMNVSIAMDNEEGDNLTGNYAQMAVVMNLIISIPASIVAVATVPPIMTWIGYGGKVVTSCYYYSMIACTSNLMDNTLSMISIAMDIGGHARFNAIFDFWETVLTIVVTAFVVPLFQPSLITLGVVYLVQDSLMTILYFGMTCYSFGWFDRYYNGFFTKLDIRLSNSAIQSVLQYSIPFLLGEILEEGEWTLLAYFAAFQGKAEAATWIILYYIWSFLTVIPENWGSAAALRVAKHLTNQNVVAAKQVVLSAIKFVFGASILLGVILFCARSGIIHLLSVDETLDMMLLEIVPYIVLCNPFIAVGTIASDFNEHLAMYGKSTVVYFLVTLLITLPTAALMTYYFHYNIEGLASAICISSTFYGVFNLFVFLNSNWARKSEEDCSVTSESNSLSSISVNAVARNTIAQENKREVEAFEDHPI